MPKTLSVLTVCYIYPPEIQPAGVMVHELSEYLAQCSCSATVITGFPNHPHGRLFPGYRKRWREWHQREPFAVLRVWHTTFPQRSLLSRMAFYGSFALSSLLNGLLCKRHDLVFSLSTPVIGGLTCLLLARLKRSCFLYGIWDVYPETAVQAGVIPRGWVASLLRRLDTWICCQADKVILPSESFRRLLLARGVPIQKMVTLPLWIDEKEVQPRERMNRWRTEQGIDEATVVILYAGTIGLISGAQYVVEVARLLQHRKVLFLFVGEGVARDEIAEKVKVYGLRNIRILPFQPRERLAEVQATADISLVTLKPGYGMTSVPSKVLGYMAAARPVIAAVDTDSETARWLRAAKCGLVVPPQDPHALAEAIQHLADDPALRRQMGENGRQYLVTHHAKTTALTAYIELFTALKALYPQRTDHSVQVGGK
ncbi:MAG: glycosyltransferase family 4 protein [Candidatus Zipacnadales bacterium]